MPSEHSPSTERANQLVSYFVAIAAVFATFYSSLLSSDFWSVIIISAILLLTVISLLCFKDTIPKV